MLYLGRFNTLTAVRKTANGMILSETGGDLEILLPKRNVPKGLKSEDCIDVFLYTDSEDRIVATTQTPKILLEQLAVLEVSDVNQFGAFLDWGLEKDLFLPFAEQKVPVQKGDRVTVYLDFDEKSDRLVASSKINEFAERGITVEEGEEVEVVIDRETDLGYQVIIHKQCFGLIYYNEVFRRLRKGDQLRGFIKRIREDGKIDVSLQKQGYDQVIDSQELLLKKLEKNNGVLFLTDRSHPNLIAEQLQVSKKVFKKCVGALYRQRKIKIESDRIVLCKADS